jgi:hypothetical protein
MPLTLRNPLFACAIAASLSACGGPLVFTHAIGDTRTDAIGGRSRGDLLYVGSKRHIEVYDYPGKSLRKTFRSSGLVLGMCSDAQGNVFVAASTGSDAGEIDEYAHGGSAPIASLQLPAHDIPVGCSSDPTTHNLAVPAYEARNFAPKIAIYPGGQGVPKIYRSKALGANPQAGYDDQGNLFATSGGNVGIELRQGKSAFKRITLDQTLGGVGHVQWDGSDWAVQSFGVSKHNRNKIAERVFHLSIVGKNAQVVGSSRFERWLASRAGQSWIAGDTIVGTPNQRVVFWHYPAGGTPFQTITPPYGSVAVTVSSAR